MRLKCLSLIVLGLVVVFSGCDAGHRTTLENNHWTLISFEDAAGNVIEVPQEMASTLYFDKANKRVTGTVRCNRLSSTYRASWRRISFGVMAITKMGCGPDPEGQEQFVLNVLSNLTTYSIKKDTLQLYSKSGNTLTYMVEEILPPDSQVLQIEIGSSFGMCLGDCKQTMTVTPQTIRLTKSGYPAGDYPEVIKEIATSPEQWNELVALLDLGAINRLPEVIGCPDCADQGAEKIVISTAEATKQVAFEFNASIKEIEPFLTELRALKEEMFAQYDRSLGQGVLDQQRALWELKGIDNYSFTFHRFTFFMPEEEDIVVTVEAGQVVSAFYTPSGEALSDSRVKNLATIDDLFDMVQDAINKQVYELQVKYDSEYGYPAYIFINVEAEMYDEEMAYRIMSFQPL